MRPIDADALKQQIESPYTEYPIMIQIRKTLKDFIDDAPSIDIEPKRGEWIEMYRNGFGNMIYMCSKCNFHATKSNFCPNCGADMREGTDNE